MRVTALPRDGVQFERRKAILVLTRQTPGDSVSSLLFSGLFEYLLSRRGAVLRAQYVFYLVPVLNPDGV